MAGDSMQVWANKTVLSLFPKKGEAYFFDGSGRCFAAWDHRGFIQRGLSGRMVARRWKKGSREIHRLSSKEGEDLLKRCHRVLEAALKQGGSALCKGGGPDTTPAGVRKRLEGALAFDYPKEEEQFRQVYRPVGILPPDQYNACVIQVAEGCRWNRCGFCSFYRGRTFGLKKGPEIRSHIQKVADFLGEGIARRRSIFLGEANALGAPLDLLLAAMDAAYARLVPKMEGFRGFYAFIEPSDSACRTTSDFLLLEQKGLRRLYYGLETGDPSLRQRLGKPGSLLQMEKSIRQAKAAGLKVAVILLVGAGGRAGEDGHIENSIRLVRRLPLEPSDIVFLSPLRGRQGAGEEPLSEIEMKEQILAFRKGFLDQACVALYDIREFAY